MATLDDITPWWTHHHDAGISAVTVRSGERLFYYYGQNLRDILRDVAYDSRPT